MYAWVKTEYVKFYKGHFRFVGDEVEPVNHAWGTLSLDQQQTVDSLSLLLILSSILLLIAQGGFCSLRGRCWALG